MEIAKHDLTPAQQALVASHETRLAATLAKAPAGLTVTIESESAYRPTPANRGFYVWRLIKTINGASTRVAYELSYKGYPFDDAETQIGYVIL